MFAVFHVLGTQPCLRGILNKLHKGEHNSGNFLEVRGEYYQGHMILKYWKQRDFLMSVSENIGLGIALSMRGQKREELPSSGTRTL